MTISTIRGIVIKETFSGDSDKYIIIFAKDIGKVSVFAKGARKLKSKFLAGTALFTYGDFIVKEVEVNTTLIQLILLRIFMD